MIEFSKVARASSRLLLLSFLLLMSSAAVGSSLAQDPFAQLLAAAEGGDPASQVRAGVAYATGDGVRVNGPEAVRWLERAAAGSGKIAAVAAGWLGVVHERGMGVRKTGETAVRWYTRGAELGSGSSAQNLGELYLAGSLVKKNEKLGYEWYARAVTLYEAEAAAGDAKAAYQAARIYHRGVGVTPDPTKATALLEIASAAGNADAIKLLNEIRAQPRGLKAAAPANPAQSRATDPSCGADVKQCVTNTFIKWGGNVDQLTITKNAQLGLTGADRANGITEKWCVNVYFVWRHSSNGRWEDRYRTVLVVRDKGALRADAHMNYSGKESEAAESFARCLRNEPPA